MVRILYFLIILFFASVSIGQVGSGSVGIGTVSPDLSAILDIVSYEKGILIPRVSLTGSKDMTTIAQGNKISLLVYNTSYVNDVVRGFYFWNGQKRSKLAEGNNAVFSGTGVPNVNNPEFPNEGDFYVELPSGNLHHFDGEGWSPLMGVSHDPENLLSIGSDGKYFLNQALVKAAISVENGLSKSHDHAIQLGGLLIKPTTIQTTAVNTLAVAGLLNSELNQDEIVTINPVSGVLGKTDISNIVIVHESMLIGTDGQTNFQTPAQIYDIKKVHVYRNGVRINLTYVNTNTIKLEEGVSCSAGDEIRIVQFN